MDLRARVRDTIRSKILLLSLALAAITSWLIKGDATPYVLMGRTFEGRGLSVRIALLIFYIVLTSALYLVVLRVIENLLRPKMDLINRSLRALVSLSKRLVARLAAWLPAKRLSSGAVAVANSVDNHLRTIYSALSGYLRENAVVLIVLAGVALAAYGFELFNLNITIDEEYYAFNPTPIQWAAQARWGMYLLTRFIIPYDVLPFVPLGLALVFHVAGILLMLAAWEVESRLERTIIAAIALTFPGLAYAYTFSTLNYGIGVGFFCVGLSVFLYSKGTGAQKYLAVIPATFALAIYQAFVLPLIFVFLIYLAVLGFRRDLNVFGQLIAITPIVVLASLFYFVVQKLVLWILSIPLSSYVVQRFDVTALLTHPGDLMIRYWDMMLHVYSGDPSLYVTKVKLLGILLIAAWLSMFANLLRFKAPIITRAILALITVMLILLPFISGFITNGAYEMRFLLGVPIVIAGFMMFALNTSSRIYKALLGVLAVACIFQFTESTNRLFASSNLALQADRALATRLIDRIEMARSEDGSGGDIRYLEIVGLHINAPTDLVPKISTFGASFFEWDQGDSSRPLAFMQTLGFKGLVPPPLERRYQLVQPAESMPAWPARGSVVVVGDTVLVKFAPYSPSQKRLICGWVETHNLVDDLLQCGR